MSNCFPAYICIYLCSPTTLTPCPFRSAFPSFKGITIWESERKNNLLTFHSELNNSSVGAIVVGGSTDIATSIAVLHSGDHQLVGWGNTNTGRWGERPAIQATPHHIKGATAPHLAPEANRRPLWFLQCDGADHNLWPAVH